MASAGARFWYVIRFPRAVSTFYSTCKSNGALPPPLPGPFQAEPSYPAMGSPLGLLADLGWRTCTTLSVLVGVPPPRFLPRLPSLLLGWWLAYLQHVLGTWSGTLMPAGPFEIRSGSGLGLGLGLGFGFG